MSNLVPEVRADKNGNLTTRWVKPEWAKGQSANKKIPKVSLQGVGPHSTLLRIITGGSNWGNRAGLESAIGRVLTEKKAEELVDFLLKKRATSSADLNKHVMINIENPRIGSRLNDLLISHYDRARDEGITGTVHFLTAIGEISRDLTTEQEWALLKVTDAASHSDAVEHINVPFPFDAYGLRNEGLINLVLDNPEKADDIARIVREREIEDADTILGLLDSDNHSSLSSGDL